MSFHRLSGVTITDVSADGSVLLLQYPDGSTARHRWRVDPEPTPLPVSNLRAFSSDARYFAGRDSDQREAYRWSDNLGLELLGRLPAGTAYSDASDISGDGSIVVGCSNTDLGERGFRWTSETGIINLGLLEDDSLRSRRSDAVAVSGDGAVIVGSSSSALGTQAVLWRSNGQVIGLGDLPGGGFGSWAVDTSWDGTVVIGGGSSDKGSEPFRWTAQTGMVGLGFIPGWVRSYVSACSSDGSVIVGAGSPTPTNKHFPDRVQATIWNAQSGLRLLGEVLAFNGVDIGDLRIRTANAVSADGSTIVGTSVRPDQAFEGWIAVASPHWGSVAAGPIDSDMDGILDAGEIYTTGTDPNNPDSDGDGLGDLEEFRFLGTDPNLADTDGDGFDDGFEVFTGFDPTSSQSVPDVYSSVRRALEVKFLPSDPATPLCIETTVDLVAWHELETGAGPAGPEVVRFYSTTGEKEQFFRTFPPSFLMDFSAATEITFIASDGTLYAIEASSDRVEWVEIEGSIIGSGETMSRYYSDEQIDGRQLRVRRR